MTTKELIERGFDDSRPNSSKGSRVACSQCEATVINGLAIHEFGCPNTKHECKGCNALVMRGVTYCEDCR